MLGMESILWFNFFKKNYISGRQYMTVISKRNLKLFQNVSCKSHLRLIVFSLTGRLNLKLFSMRIIWCAEKEDIFYFVSLLGCWKLSPCNLKVDWLYKVNMQSYWSLLLLCNYHQYQLTSGLKYSLSLSLSLSVPQIITQKS